MKALFDLGDRYAAKSDWTDFALTKLCLFSMGLYAGTRLPERYKKTAVGLAAAGFALSYVPLMARVFRTAAEMSAEKQQG